MAYSSDSKIWKGVFGHKKAFGMVQSLIRRMANYHISKMVAKYAHLLHICSLITYLSDLNF